MVNKKHILWVDDEVELLKSHIIYLKKRGYHVTSVNSGEDAIELCSNESVDLVLMDEMMTGLDGLTTLKYLKERNPALPIIMVTKNEEEWLMEEAIGEKIENYLTKPVNPSQVYIACKNILDNKRISSEKSIKEFLEFYSYIQNLDFPNLNYKDWIKINNSLCQWSIKLDDLNNQEFKAMLDEQKKNINKLFYDFYISNYKTWINNKSRPYLSADLFDNVFLPKVKSDKNLIIIIIDCLRMDQWMKISPLLENDFKINEDNHFAIIPSATPFARNAIFSGLMPLDIKNKHAEIWDKMFKEGKMNQFEDQLLLDRLKRENIKQSMKYVKISDYEEGKKFHNKINDYKEINILSIVVNFVDILGHTRSESEILKELIPNESAYRQAIYNWFEKSWLNDCFKEFKNWNSDIIITSDHGNTKVNKPVAVKADNTASSGIRYKYGRNFGVDDKKVLKIKNPKDFKLPSIDINTEYIIAKDFTYFVYTNQYHKYVNIYKDSFQHGGISMDEIIVPLIELKNK